MEKIGIIEIILLTVVLISTVINWFFSSFVKEKGKNLATRQDIEKITTEIEKIKNIYNRDLEKYKIDLTQDYELKKSQIDFTNEIDRELILLIDDFSESNANLRNTHDHKYFIQVIKKLQVLGVFLSKKNYRYGKNENIQELLRLINFFIFKAKDNEANMAEYSKTFTNIQIQIDSLMNKFVKELD